MAVLVDVYSEIREEQGAGFSDVHDGTFMFNFFLNKIKAFHSKIAYGKAHSIEENAHKNKPADIKSNDFERTSDEERFSSTEKSYSIRPRCPRECLYIPH